MSDGLGTASAPPAGVAASNITRAAPLAAAAIGILAGLVRYGASSRGVVTAALLGSLGLLAVIDWRQHVVPNLVVLPATALVLGLRLALFPDQALEWVLASVVTCAVLLALSMLKRESLGAGDAKLGLLLGAGLGADVAVATLIGVVALWPVAAYLVFHEGVDARKKAIPLAPAFAFGAAVVALTG
jgi:prepilin signal peptidase PulO-like enzyme (type II secretory pathway)